MQSVSQELLDSLNVEQDRDENRKKLDSIGGIDKLLAILGSDASSGLSSANAIAMREKFGSNKFPEAPMKNFFSLWMEALGDRTLIILTVAAKISIVIGIIEEGEEKGWIEGAAILIAVFLVSLVSSANDYSKELQFRALENSSQADERTSVIRGGSIERINPTELVVGDVVLLQAGDSIPADCVLVDHNVIMSSEAALTGESDDVKKSRNGDCFLLSSCLITSGEEAHGLVIGIGEHSQWGKIKANLVAEAVNTPLQDKLEIMAERVICCSHCDVILINLFVHVSYISDWVHRINWRRCNFYHYGDQYLGP